MFPSDRSHVITPPDRWLVSLTLSEQKEIVMIYEMGKVSEQTKGFNPHTKEGILNVQPGLG
jgi:hypothetical protein